MPSLQPAFEGAVPSANIPPTDQAASLAPAAHSVVVHESSPPSSPQPPNATPRPIISRVSQSQAAPTRPPGALYPPATLRGIDATGTIAEDWDDSMGQGDMVLELADGLALSGHSFGANKSVSGECVFQTGLCTLTELVPPS